jgi:CubicO group peptidase (beta-lactamase class C family)
MYRRNKISGSITSTSLRVLLFIVLTAILWTGCGKSDAPTSPSIPDNHFPIPPQIGDGLETGSFYEVGMEPGPFIELVDSLDSTPDHRIHSILVFRYNKLVFEKYWDGYDMTFDLDLSLEMKQFDIETLHYQASVSKSVTSALMGIALDKGLISSVEETVFFFFPEYDYLMNEDNRDITIEQMLKMTSGYEWNESVYDPDDPRDSHYQMFASHSPLVFLLGRDVISEPGSSFRYNSGDVNLLGEIIRRESSSDYLYEFAEDYLFGPLGIDAYHWVRFPLADFITFASGGLFLKPRDALKIGTLYLNDGQWNGEQIISSAWIHESFENIKHIVEPYDYGYLWWLAAVEYKSDTVQTYCAIGWGGQHIVVIPELDLAVVGTAGGYSEDPLLHRDDIINDYVLRAIID